MLQQVEKKRLECFVHRKLAVWMLRKELNEIDYLSALTFTRNASSDAGHWFILAIRDFQNPRQKTEIISEEANGITLGNDTLNQSAHLTSTTSDKHINRDDSSDAVTTDDRANAAAETNETFTASNDDLTSKRIGAGSPNEADPVPMNRYSSDIKLQAVKTTGNSIIAPSIQSGNATDSSAPLSACLLEPVVAISKAIAAESDCLVDLTAASNDFKEEIANLHNIHVNHIRKFIMLVQPQRQKGVAASVLISSDYISLKNDFLIDAYRFPLVIAAPARRIVMTLHNNASRLNIGYAPIYGVLEECCEIQLTVALCSPYAFRLLGWLLLLLESSHHNFYDSTSLTRTMIDKAIGRARDSDFQALLAISSRQEQHANQRITPQEQTSQKHKKDTPDLWLERIMKNDACTPESPSSSNDPIVKSRAASQLFTHAQLAWDWTGDNDTGPRNEPRLKELAQLQESQASILNSAHICDPVELLQLIQARLSKLGAHTSRCLKIHPPQESGTAASKAANLHGLSKLGLGRLLLHLNVGRIRGGSGILVYENGFSMCNGLKNTGFIEFGHSPSLSNPHILKVLAKDESTLVINLVTEAGVGGAGKTVEYRFKVPPLVHTLLISHLARLLVALDSSAHRGEELARLVQAEWRLARSYPDLRPITTLSLSGSLRSLLLSSGIVPPLGHQVLLEFSFGFTGLHRFMLLGTQGIYLSGIAAPDRRADSTQSVFIDWHSLNAVDYDASRGAYCFRLDDTEHLLRVSQGKWKQHAASRLNAPVLSSKEMKELAGFIASLKPRFARKS